MSQDVLIEVLTEFLEVWFHNVIYVSNIYPSKVFRPRYKYSINLKQSVYPSLNNYIRELVLSFQPQLRQQAIQSITVNISRDLEILESFSLNISYPSTNPSQLPPPEELIHKCKDTFRGHIASLLNCNSDRLSSDGGTDDGRSFSVSVRTTELVASQMSAWCSETIRELDASSCVTPLIFSDLSVIRIQSSHRK